ncbi:unnamed protein product [Vitrella brassicaformis CCMP3155]|uniref:Uncharacterized protein n=2 Tax=Vitrella brassicaformis TaxID=1169539 RepID=A0A0G4F4J8_VITBC|nr:unnamed protein product [Vitrella brassicaformis CCMP3155]|eukprot:CEM06726.1 unnamed protein product [Vitrella brassicaformis CCMP3155]
MSDAIAKGSLLSQFLKLQETTSPSDAVLKTCQDAFFVAANWDTTGNFRAAGYRSAVDVVLSEHLPAAESFLRRAEGLAGAAAATAATAEDDMQRSALHWASGSGCVELCRLLIDNGALASIDKYDSKRRTPLLWAVARGAADVCKYLLLKGADPHLPNRKGLEPLHLARQVKSYSCIDVLTAHIRAFERSKSNTRHPTRPTPPAPTPTASFCSLPSSLNTLLDPGPPAPPAAPSQHSPVARHPPNPSTTHISRSRGPADVPNFFSDGRAHWCAMRQELDSIEGGCGGGGGSTVGGGEMGALKAMLDDLACSFGVRQQGAGGGGGGGDAFAALPKSHFDAVRHAIDEFDALLAKSTTTPFRVQARKSSDSDGDGHWSPLAPFSPLPRLQLADELVWSEGEGEGDDVGDEHDIGVRSESDGFAAL